MADMKSMLQRGLKDMKVSRLADEKVEPAVTDEEYPWGLRVTLDDKALDKLNLDISKVNVDDEVCLKCRANVISVRHNKSGYGDNKSVELQLTHIGIEEED